MINNGVNYTYETGNPVDVLFKIKNICKHSSVINAGYHHKIKLLNTLVSIKVTGCYT